MRTILTVFAALVLSAPAIAQERCYYENGYGERLFFSEEQLFVEGDQGDYEVCELAFGHDPSDTLAMCENLGEQPYDLHDPALAFMNKAWVRQCTEGV